VTHRDIAVMESNHRSQRPMPLLLTAAEAAALCARSVRTWHTWNAAGFIPKPIRIGRSTLWRADELRAWVAAGCPCREKWDIQRESADTQ
jgi:prophage regulatory protein